MARTPQSTNPVRIHKNFDEEKETQAETWFNKACALSTWMRGLRRRFRARPIPEARSHFASMRPCMLRNSVKRTLVLQNSVKNNWIQVDSISGIPIDLSTTPPRTVLYVFHYQLFWYAPHQRASATGNTPDSRSSSVLDQTNSTSSLAATVIYYEWLFWLISFTISFSQLRV